jgi:pyridoxine 5-phosphate synthase
MSIALSVNLNKIALLRNSREGNYPDPVAFGRVCLEAGAQGLTVHPRPDGRHIRIADVYALRKLVEHYPGTEFNIEGNPFAPARDSYPGLLALVADTAPHQCTLVPDSDSQLTSDHGFDLMSSGSALAPILARLRDLGVRSSLFMDPNCAQIRAAKTLQADRIELYTGPFAEAVTAWSQHVSTQDSAEQTSLPPRVASLLSDYQAAAIEAHGLGLGVNAGHDLNLINLPIFRQVPYIAEVSIGHALTVDALWMGFHAAVQAYLEACRP